MGMQDFIGKNQKKETERKTQYMYVCMYEYAVFTKYGTVYLFDAMCVCVFRIQE